MAIKIKEKILSVTLILVGLIFAVEASFVLYAIGLVPAAMQLQEPMAIALGYAVLKIIVGLIALIGGAYSLVSKSK